MASAGRTATLFKGYWSLNFGLTLHQHSTSAGDITEQHRRAKIWNDLCCHLLDANVTARWRASVAGGKKGEPTSNKESFAGLQANTKEGEMFTFSEEKSK